MPAPIHLSGLSKKEAIIDACYRAVLGIDTNDIEMMHSGMTKDIEMGLGGHSISGLQAVDELVIQRVGPMDTTHTLSNFRIDLKDGADTATLTCIAVAQHYREGEGADPKTEHMMTGGIYHIDVVEDKSDGLWKVKKWIAEFKWRDGEETVTRLPDLSKLQKSQ